jgi:adenylate cyclase
MSSPTRQFAAIMFTDIVGYTTMMGQDESKTIELLRFNRSIHLRMIEKYHGKLVKEIGDGMLAKFSNSVDAVFCARDIQLEAVSLTGKIRIGIHLGNVTIENNDVFGNGVNIASRLQSAADPGGIFISDTVYEEIEGISSLNTVHIGEVLLKNVEKPVTTYAIVEDYLPKTSRHRVKILTGSSTIESLAVMPFQNLSGDPKQQYFVDGMQDALITELSQISSLRVISRTSTMRYRDSMIPIIKIAEELGVDAILEATVTRHKATVKIQVELIKTIPQEEQLWASTYDKQIENVLEIYHDVVKDITNQIGIKLTGSESEHLAKSYQVNPEAYEAYMKGLFHWEKLEEDALTKSLEYFTRSTEQDKMFGLAFTGIAGVWLARVQMGLISREVALPYVYQNIYKSIDLDDSIADTYYWRASLNVWMDWEWEKGLKSFKAALDINPNLAIGRAYLAHLLIILGKPEEAISEIELAVQLDPFNTLLQSLYGMVLNYTREFERAKRVLLSILNKDQKHPIALSTLRSVYHNLGEYDEAFEIFKLSYLQKGLDKLVTILIDGYKTDGYQMALSKVAEAMISNVGNDYSTPWQIATLFTRAGNKDKAIEYLNKAYEIKDPNMPYVEVDPIFDILKNDRDYISLLDKMNLNKCVTKLQYHGS